MGKPGSIFISYRRSDSIATVPSHNVSVSPAQLADARPTPNMGAIRLPMILSGVSGVFALYDGISGGGTANWMVAILLFGAVIILMTRKLWAWGIAIAIQASALVVFSVELSDVFSSYYLYDEVSLYDLIVIIPVVVLSLITTAILLLPKTRRNFS